MKLSTSAILLTLCAVPIGIGLAVTGGPYGVIFYLLAVPAVVALIGGALAITSLVRKERPLWLSILALLISVGPALGLAAAIAYKQFDEYQYQNRLGPYR